MLPADCALALSASKAEQTQAAREEQAERRAEPGQGHDLPAVEEQGW